MEQHSIQSTISFAESQAPSTTIAAPSTTIAGTSTRNVQHVLNHTQKGVIVSWMVNAEQTGGAKHLCARTVRHFPRFFRGSTKANLQRASRYWKSRDSILSHYRNPWKKGRTVITRCTGNGVVKYTTKAGTGRGRKRLPWTTLLYKELMEEFERLRTAGVRFNRALLKTLALRIIQRGDNLIIGPEVRDSRTGMEISRHITTRWVQHFMQSNDVVCRSQCGKLMVSPAKKELIEREVAYHLGELRKQFVEKTLLEDDVMNADETHFVINMHNHKSLAKRGVNEVKYADVVSGDEGMTMLVLLTGGKQSMIQPPFMIFKNDNSSYPIRGVPDDVPGVSYRTGPKGWMDSRVFGEWLNENRAVSNSTDGRRRVLFMDNCSGHALTGEVRNALARKNIQLRFFPANATDLVQPADSHLIQKVKAAWRARWNEKVLDMIEKRMWVDPRKGSGKLVNPGKAFFLRLAADSVRDVNGARHKDGTLYSRRAMMRCGLALNEYGEWKEEQLSKELQNIVAKYRDNFNGTPVDMEQDLEGEATDTDDDNDS